jgi:regulator of protease activity HflC (stomatin/prohibitin superfamily)
LALLVALTGLELSARALGRLFLPPPSPTVAQAAVQSLIARIVAAGAAVDGGIGAPLRQHLGIDFSRSWALAYVRAAALPMLAFFLLLAWGLSGVSLVPLDGRAVYERFGAPVAVWHPGLHLGLQWPLGGARALEYGPVHEIGLTGNTGPIEHIGAEDPAPASANRLWEQAHPEEVELLIASAANGRESFQSVSADLRILYRVGLSDEAALRAAYASANPETLVRSAAGRAVADYFVGRTLDQVLGADRAAMAEALRTGLQEALDRAGSGLDAVAVVIEAVHPPAGAADAYHNVRAAEIAAQTSVAVERGAAATVHAQSLQYAFDQTANATADAAETVAAAKTAHLRFTADQEAASVGGRSFLLERYFSALTSALGKAPKTIIDHRLNTPDATVLDLRPLVPGAGPAKEE